MPNVSQYNSRFTLDFLKQTRENQYFERKGIAPGESIKPSKIANELIGMLNADGGVLALGVSNDGEIQDLNTLDPELLDRYRKVYHEFVKPSCKIHLEELVLDSGELIFLYHVDQDYEHMFMRNDNEEVYLRVGDACLGPLSREKCTKLEYDKSLRRYEDEDRTDFDPQDFRPTVLDFYKKKINFEGTPDELMLSRHLARRVGDKIAYKNSAILLFSEDPDKYIPSSLVRYIRYNGVEQLTGQDYNVIKDERFYGCIPRLVEVVKTFLGASMKDYYFLDISEGKFIKISEYPDEAWLEGLVNALCHRSYNVQGNAIYIRHFDNRLEISNSGPLPGQVTVENIQETRFSRNPRIARVLFELGYVRELNEGVKRIFEIMKKSLLSSPEYLNKNDTVTLILRNDISGSKKTISEEVMKKIESKWSLLNETQKLLLQFLFSNHTATLDKFIEHSGKSEELIRKYLNQFVEDNILEKLSIKIRDKNAIYVFKGNIA